MTRAFHDLARPFLDAGVLAPSDVHAVALVAPRFGEAHPARLLGLAFAVRAPRVGHAGVDLGAVATRVTSELEHRPARADAPSSDDADVAALPWPAPDAWAAATLASPLVGPPVDPALRPFVRQDLGDGTTLLLTRRMFREQERVASALRARAAATVDDAALLARVDAALARLFAGDPAGEPARAVRLAASCRLAIVVGGPGTGKTFSITRLLAALLEAHRGERPLEIHLAAPTGKAAVRMREAIREATAADAKPPLDVGDDVRGRLQGLTASTLHRLIGVRPDGTVRHDGARPLTADVVVVDEVSMVDLTLMRQLVEAVPPTAHLVLLGDRDQLASVEAGCVLADLVGGREGGPLAPRVQAFTHSHRFASAPDIALIAACLQSYATRMAGVPATEAARIDRAVDVFLGRHHHADELAGHARVTYLGPPEPGPGSRPARPSAAALDALARGYTEGFTARDHAGAPAPVEGYATLLSRALRGGRGWSAAAEPAVQRALLDALGRYRVLAVHRRGPLGVSGLEDALAERVRAFLARSFRDDGGRHWLGRPVLVTENAYDVGLMNGDVGLVLPAPGGRAAVFPHEAPGAVRVVPLSRLPAHEGALAMTVHKSQGSQFDRVALVLAGRPSPIQTRELVYTGVTRAKQQLVWLGGEAELRQALGVRVERASGLDPLLRAPADGDG